MSERVLLIEDNERNRYLLTYLLEHRGLEVVCAADGPAGLALAGRVHPTLVLLDIQLPGMHGYDVARALRAEPATRDLPIIAVTSHAMVGDREAAIAAGCDGYIEKPIDPDTFFDQIRPFLRAADGGTRS